MSRRAILAGGATAVALLLAPAPALAHGLVGKTDLPIPRWLFAWAAAVVLVLSFVALATLWPKPRLDKLGERELRGYPRLLDPLCGLIGSGSSRPWSTPGSPGGRSRRGTSCRRGST